MTFRSKHVESCKNCRINTYRKCILLVCLYDKLQSVVTWSTKQYISTFCEYVHPFANLFVSYGYRYKEPLFFRNPYSAYVDNMVSSYQR
jgi:hypothetical protein